MYCVCKIFYASDVRQCDVLTCIKSFSSFYENLGPDANCFEAWSEKELGPIRVAEGTMAFMFETSFGLALTKWGQELCGKIDENYKNDWKGIKANFDGLNLGQYDLTFNAHCFTFYQAFIQSQKPIIIP